MTPINTLRNPNSVVTPGAPVNGRIVKKGKDFVVVHFHVGAVKCSGVLHVSEFPSLARNERDAMFGVAKVGMPANGLVVLTVTPPQEGQHFSKVRLSALQPLKDAAATLETIDA